MVKKIRVLIALVSAAAAAAVILILVQPKADSGGPVSPDEADSYFEQMISSGKIPGISVAVMKNGRAVYCRGFGTADAEGSAPVTADTIFPWWSVTKLYTSAAILQLVEQGLLALDDPVDRYLPWFTLTTKDGKPADVTVKQLLNHQSGLKDFIPEGLAWIRHTEEPPVNQTDFLKQRIAGDYRRLTFAPGTKTRYTNTEYVVLSAVIESVAGLRYEEFVEKNILKPLSLNDTGFVRSQRQQGRTAAGSMKRPGFFPIMLRIFGPDNFYDDFIEARTAGRYWMKPVYTDYTASTGLSGTVEELAAFGSFLMNGTREQDVLDTVSLKMMQVDLSLSELPESYSNAGDYGLGMELWRYGDQRVYGHGGGGPGYGALLAFIPGRQLVIAVCANDTAIDRDGIFRALAGIEW